MRSLSNVQVGTLGGTLCSIWINLSLGDIVQTVVMAAIGVVTSYVVSRWLDRKR